MGVPPSIQTLFWGVLPERVHTPAGKPGRNELVKTLAVQNEGPYNRHRGYNIKSQAMKMPCPRRIKKRINIHKLLDSHYALGAFHVNESDPDCYYRDQQEMVRVRYYKLGRSIPRISARAPANTATGRRGR